MEHESPLCRTFFRFVHELRADVAREYAENTHKRLGVPQDSLQAVLDEACETVLFRVFTLIDGVTGHDDFPDIELVDEHGESINAAYLHDLYFDYKPDS